MHVHASWILADSATKKSNGGSSLLLVIVVAGFLLYMFNRSQKSARRKNAARQNQIEVGQQVITSAGIYATVVSVDDESFELQVAEGVVIRFAKGAVTRAVPVQTETDSESENDAETSVSLDKPGAPPTEAPVRTSPET